LLLLVLKAAPMPAQTPAVPRTLKGGFASFSTVPPDSGSGPGADGAADKELARPRRFERGAGSSRHRGLALV
jgi:hypothetical protein